MARKKRPAVKTTTLLKKELDFLVSRYVRLSAANKRGYVLCYTCGKRAKWNDGMQCGHFIRRQYLATRFDLKNLKVQCIGCNIYGDGKMVEFAKNLEAETPGIVAQLYRDAQKIVKDYPYSEEIARYKELLKKFEHLTSRK